jgi:hypothetical protein
MQNVKTSRDPYLGLALHLKKLLFNSWYSTFKGLKVYGYRISIFLYFVKGLLAHPRERREGKGTADKQWLAAVPCPPPAPLVERRVHIHDQHKKILIWKITDHKWKQ